MENVESSLHHCKFEVPEIIFGRGMLNQIGSCARRLGGHKVFLVSDQGLFNAGWVDIAIKNIMDAGLTVILYDNITINPKDVEVEAGALEYIRHGADVIVGLGGGAPWMRPRGSRSSSQTAAVSRISRDPTR